jgi:hypothetical protein
MSDETQAGRRYGLWIALALVLAPLLYTLSVGPVVDIVERNDTGLEAARVVYSPLEWVAENTRRSVVL